MTATVSVVIPVHNAAEFLGETLASVRAQTVAPLETIVIDDGSTDGSATVASAAGVTVIRLPDQQGVSAARNAGIRQAKGEWIALLDADDVWLPTKLETQLNAIGDRDDVELCTMHFRYFLHPGAKPPPALDPSILGQPQPKTIPSTWLIRKACFDRVGLFREDLQVAEDITWIANANTLGIRLLALDDCLVDKRIHERNISGHFQETYSNAFAALRHALGQRRSAAP